MTDVPSPTVDRAAVAAFVTQWIDDEELLTSPPEPASTLEAIGFDSLALVDLAVAVKRKLGVAVQPSDFHPYASFADTIDTIVARSGVS